MGNTKPGITVYCHFSFRRPKEKNYGIFAVAFYKDFEGKKLITYKVRKQQLWEDQQFITAIQSYEHALQTIYEFQGQMKQHNISQIMLVTDNSTLAGWIINPKKNKQYSSYMERAVKAYRVGAYREIVLGVGLCEPRKAEKSYKYCKEENVTVDENTTSVVNEAGEYRVSLNGMEYKSIIDIIQSDKSIPTISGKIDLI